MSKSRRPPEGNQRLSVYEYRGKCPCGATSELLSALASVLACSRKEVIQPQVPLRLPCYDFAPVTELAFGRSLPCGLGDGLRALPASMA
jgi:hypothetical protein